MLGESEHVDRVLKRLRRWCDDPEKRWGRRSEAARAIGVAPQVITDWLTKRQRKPTAEQVLRLIKFLDLVGAPE
jgi:predicted transcriptional regulator